MSLVSFKNVSTRKNSLAELVKCLVKYEQTTEIRSKLPEFHIEEISG